MSAETRNLSSDHGNGPLGHRMCALKSVIGPVVDESLVVSHEIGSAKQSKVLTLGSSLASALDFRTRTYCMIQHRPTSLFQPLTSHLIFWSTTLHSRLEECDVGDHGKTDRGGTVWYWKWTRSSRCRTALCVEFPERDRVVDEKIGASCCDFERKRQ